MGRNSSVVVLILLQFYLIYFSDCQTDLITKSKGFTSHKHYEIVRYQPRHIHISYGEDPTTQMVITWSTVENPNGTIVEFGRRYLAERIATGNVTEFVDKGSYHLKQFIHRVTLTDLVPGERYLYHVGSDLGWSEIFYFNVIPNGTDWLPRVAIYGDLGTENAQSLSRLQRETHLGLYDAVIHVGDFAYNMETENGIVGDVFMEQIQSVAAYVPYMVCPGNHESADNFFHYKNRFSMPGGTESMYYSWNLGPIHFLSISTEFYYYLQYGLKPVSQQFSWITDDLEEANKNRSIRPWIIVYGHRPMYCSNADSDDCTTENDRVRIGLPSVKFYGLEDVFMNFGVDLVIWAHEHSYERLWPLYNYTVLNGSIEEPYRNPKALTHVITGSAGCKSKHDPFNGTIPDYSAFRTTDYGYSKLIPLNSTHLYFEQISDDQGGAVIDSFTLIRESHDPYEIPSQFQKNEL